MSDSSPENPITPQAAATESAGGPVKLPPLKLPPKPVAAGIPGVLPSSPGPLTPPPSFKPPSMPSAGGIPAATPPTPSVPQPPTTPGSVRPIAVAPAPSKPLPQATIKLQAAPVPAARKPVQPVATQTTVSTPKPVVSEDDEGENAVEDLPMPFAIGALVLAAAAVGIQVWTMFS